MAEIADHRLHIEDHNIDSGTVEVVAGPLH